MNPLFAGRPTTIFEHMSGLARTHGAVNLGQGFPDFGWPEDVLAKAAEALTGMASQYPPMRGAAALREAVADHYRAHQGLLFAPEQVVVTSGATEALTASILALVSPGDEVVLFQPLYDSYLPIVTLAGGVPNLVRLTPPDWRITHEMLDAAITDRTRLVIFNNPHNPTARAFDVEEMRLVAEACVRHDVFALSDEVWEHVLFDGRTHVPLSTLPGMAERTVKIGSAGKIFSLTGWKVGWTIAPPRLAGAIANAHQFLTFTTAPNLQAAVAYGLGKEVAYFDHIGNPFQEARSFLVRELEAEDFFILPCEGTYFVNIELAASGLDVDDVTFCEGAVRDAGVAGIPVSALYADNPIRTVVRLCFAKQRETLEAGIAGLRKARTLF